jgi:hypothetical protein
VTGCCEQGLKILVPLNVGTFVCIKSSVRLCGRTVEFLILQRSSDGDGSETSV